MEEFNYIYSLPPIDFWDNVQMATLEETHRVLENMPEPPRQFENVYKTFVPFESEIVPVFMCKADNNGTVYLFCDNDIYTYLHELTIIKSNS